MTTNLNLGVKRMAKPIKLGLVLEGEAAERFDEHLEHPPELSAAGQEFYEELRAIMKARGMPLPN